MLQMLENWWLSHDAIDTYGLNRWGKTLVEINSRAHVCMVLPIGDGQGRLAVDLKSVMDRAEEVVGRSPVLLRFPQILHERVSALQGVFDEAIRQAGYPGNYRGVYPIKVNQQRSAVLTVLEAGRKHHFGLEIGSKTELAVALATLKDRQAYLVCNGHKDREFVEQALLGMRLGLRVILVIESLREARLVADLAKAHHITPKLGIRARLPVNVRGQFASSSGEQSFFGLNMDQLARVLDLLEKENLLPAVELLHSHQASQIPDLQSVRLSIQFAARLYASLRSEKTPNLHVLDLGGGLAIDYDATNSAEGSSRDYTNPSYARAVVAEVMDVLRDWPDLPAPTLMTESGRAVVAPYTALLFPVVESGEALPDDTDLEFPPCRDGDRLKDLFAELKTATLASTITQGRYALEHARRDFADGRLPMLHLTQIERSAGLLFARCLRLASAMVSPPAEARELSGQMRHFYYASFSLFQSLPDVWAIGQLFPIMPIQRLDEAPQVNAEIVDLTCDSDGALRAFGTEGEPRHYLPLHRLRPNESYYLGAFLTGAYQETLGDPHNLFGKPPILEIIARSHEVELRWISVGEPVQDVAALVDYDSGDLRGGFRELLVQAYEQQLLERAEMDGIAKAYKKSLEANTYFIERAEPKA